jgi:hypothetical protein
VSESNQELSEWARITERGPCLFERNAWERHTLRPAKCLILKRKRKALLCASL